MNQVNASKNSFALVSQWIVKPGHDKLYKSAFLVQWVSEFELGSLIHLALWTRLMDLLKRSDKKKLDITKKSHRSTWGPPQWITARIASALMWVKVCTKYTWQRTRLSQTPYLHLPYPPSLAFTLSISQSLFYSSFSFSSLTGDWVWAGVLLSSAASPPLASLCPLRGVNRLILASLSLPLLRNILPFSACCTGRLLFLQP